VEDNHHQEEAGHGYSFQNHISELPQDEEDWVPTLVACGPAAPAPRSAWVCTVRRFRILSSKWNHVDDIPWSLGPPIFLFLRSCLWFLPLCERMCVFVYGGCSFPGVGNGRRSVPLHGVLTPLFIPVAHRGEPPSLWVGCRP